MGGRGEEGRGNQLGITLLYQRGLYQRGVWHQALVYIHAFGTSAHFAVMDTKAYLDMKQSLDFVKR